MTMSDNDEMSIPGDLEFDEGTGEMSLELNLNPKATDSNPDKSKIGHVDRMKKKREREKMGLDDLEDEEEEVTEEVSTAATDDETGDIDPSALDEDDAPKVKVEKVQDAPEEEAPQEFRPPSMQEAREESSDEKPAPKKVEAEKVKDLEDALGLNEEESTEEIGEEETEQDAATRRMVLDDLMFEEGESSEDMSSGTDQADPNANMEDLEALIADEEDDDYQVEAGESAAEGVQVAGSEVNFKKEKLETSATPAKKPQAKPQAAAKAPIKGVHPKCNFCKMAHGKFKLAVLYQDEHVMAIMDPKPLSKGQLLLAPKKHVGSLTDLSDAEVQHFFNIANMLCKTLKDSKVPAEAVSYFLSESVNEAADLRHIYMSIIARTNKDGIGLKYKKKINSTPDDLELICDHLIGYIKK